MAEIKRTDAQDAVVRHRGGALLVAAAAGSGKTKVLVDRLMEQVCDPLHPKNVDDFLIITYTKLAAAELREKIASEIGRRLSLTPDNRHLQRQLSRIYLAQISTVHAFCGEILRSYAYALDIPTDFRIAEEQETLPLRERCLRRVLDDAYQSIGSEPKLRALVDTLGAGRDDGALAEIVVELYLKTQCHLDPEGWMAESERALALSSCEDAAQTAWGQELMEELRRYCSHCASRLRPLADACAQDAKLQKGYLPTLTENLALLERLRACARWDELYAARPKDFGRLGRVVNCEQPELQERIKRVRTVVWKGLKKRCDAICAPSDVVLDELRESGQAISALYGLVRAFAREYRAEKRRRHMLDFNDLEHEAVRLLLERGTQRPTAAAREIAARYAEVMVDEYQDTNAVQDAIFLAVSRDGQNRFLVGDVKQSIYRFRLADPSVFLDKYRKYTQTDSETAMEPRRILLSENFRSVPEILSAVNDVFGLVMSEEVGELRYGPTEALNVGIPREKAKTPPVELACIASDVDAEAEDSAKKEEIEAEFVAQRIDALLHGECDAAGRAYHASDIVILLRSVRSAAGYYRAALERHGIPVACDDAENLLQTAEAETLLALLQVIDNPHQDIPLLTVLSSPVFCFDNDALGRIRAAQRNTDFFDALCAMAELDDACADFLQCLRRLQAASARLSARQLMDEIDRETNFYAIYGATENGAARQANLDRFLSLVASAARDGQKSLGQVIDALQSLRAQGYKSEAETAKDAVTIMSIHKSKGLEFPVVFLCGLSKAFNRDDLKKPVLTHTTLGVGASVVNRETRVRYPTIAKSAIARRIDRENLSEEMRVLYVAMTRAQEKLIMTYCAKNLHKELSSLAQELTVPAEPALTGSVSCMGHWILMSALARTEAGELFAVAEKPACSAVHADAWKIGLYSGQAVLTAAQHRAAAVPQTRTAEEAYELPEPTQTLGFRYAHMQAAALPTKLTATQLKGRAIDEESAADAPVRQPTVHIRKPSFVTEQRGLSATERGTATHLAMQFLDYARCADISGITAELERLVAEEYLTPQQREAVSAEKIARLFASPLGQRLLHAKQPVREFKFSVLVDAARYYPDAAGEQILLQGVTDCCLLEDDGLTVIDFKTDRVERGGEAARAAYYAGQLNAYAEALARIFARPVREKILYFFATDSAVSL